VSIASEARTQNTAVERLGLPSRTDPAVVPDSSRLQYYARYFGDPVSRLFWQGEELWMGVLPPYGRRFVDLLDSQVLDELFADRLFLGLEYKSTAIDGFDGVWRLDRTPRITYWHEWSPKMWRTAALHLIEIFVRLAKQGFTLRNPHPWNLLFDGKQFSYANPGSVVPLGAAIFSQSYEKVARFFVRSLVLLENGLEHLV
jgi:hypothetical protein